MCSLLLLLVVTDSSSYRRDRGAVDSYSSTAVACDGLQVLLLLYTCTHSSSICYWCVIYTLLKLILAAGIYSSSNRERHGEASPPAAGSHTFITCEEQHYYTHYIQSTKRGRPYRCIRIQTCCLPPYTAVPGYCCTLRLDYAVYIYYLVPGGV